jgi:hypothetical protein
MTVACQKINAVGSLDVTESEWLECPDPTKMLEWLHQSRASQRKLRLFACACCRYIWHLLTDERSRKAVEVAERYADGEATTKELGAARRDARKVCSRYTSESSRYPAAAAGHASEYRAWRGGWNVAQAVASPIIHAGQQEGTGVRWAQADLLRDIFGPLAFRRGCVLPSGLTWNERTVGCLAQSAYDDRHLPYGTLDQARLAALADALEESVPVDAEILGHLRGPGPHVRGCHAVDAILGRG